MEPFGYSGSYVRPMNRRHFSTASTAILFTLLTACAANAADRVGPGSVAPPLLIKRWLKGTPIARLEPERTYVVEFWATWCGPCLDEIPHLTELARRHRDVTFIGVGVWEADEGDKLSRFTEQMGDGMDYNVGYSGNKEGMAVTWLNAADQNSIPTAFIVKDRKVLWIGHPFEIDRPLAEVKAGTFDLPAFLKRFEQETDEKLRRIVREKEFNDAVKLYGEGKRDEAKKALAEVVAKYPDYMQAAERLRYDWLASEDPAAWEARTKAILESGKTEEMRIVANFALAQVRKPAGADEARRIIGMVVKADTTGGCDLLMYARGIYLRLGDTREALEVTNRIIALLPTSPLKEDGRLKEMLLESKATLEAKLQKNGC